ncbi:MAG: hypothetical protein A2152_02200 [Candidatus Levybacteria bacterium RBG_16_35_6]|nr:MAG: hypothetical protein A2152_02200 [Candidatus Levybacteria bacterium RBG_16_35_6]
MKAVYKTSILLFFIVSVISLLKSLFLLSYPDFTAYYYNPQMAFSGQNPYLGGINLYTSTTYPPFSFLFFYPFSFLNISLSGKLFTLCSISLFFASIYLIFRIGKVRTKSYLFLFVLGLFSIYFPVKFTLGMGQINIFILFLIVLFLYFYKKSVFLSGFFLSLSFLTKLFPILLFLYLLMRKKFKILVYSLLIIMIFIAFSFLLVPKEVNLYFYQKILTSFFNSWPSDYYNQSITGVLSRGFTDNNTRILLKILFSVVFLGASFVVLLKRKTKDINLETGYLIIVSLLINPFSWQHHFVWLVLPLLLTLFLLLKSKSSLFLVLLFISYVLTALNLRQPDLFPVIFRSHVFFGALTLWILDSLLILGINAGSLMNSPKKLDQG